VVQWSSGPDLLACAHTKVIVHIISRNAVRAISGPVVQWSSGPDPLACCSFKHSQALVPYNQSSSETQWEE
jgi:hypothetical protein